MGAGVGEVALVAWFYGQLAYVRDSKTDLLVEGNAEAEASAREMLNRHAHADRAPRAHALLECQAREHQPRAASACHNFRLYDCGGLLLREFRERRALGGVAPVPAQPPAPPRAPARRHGRLL